MMQAFRHKIAFVVPTMNRPFEIRRMLQSVARQSALPAQIVIVDGSTTPIDDVIGEFPTLPLKYVRVYPPSLSKQRNAGIAVLSPEITLAGYLDDDLVLEDGCVEAMLSFWETASDDIGGAAFNIVTDRLPRGIFVKSIFYVDGFRRGAVLRSGYQSMIGPVRKNTEVDWLFGGATVWRREVTRAFDYDEWFKGTGYLEDVDFSYRVSRKYRLFVLADARVKHLTPPVRKSRDYLMGKWQAINRMYFVRKHPEFSRPLYYWATCGLVVANIAEGIVTFNRGLFLRAVGNVVGLAKVSAGRLDQLSGYLKQ